MGVTDRELEGLREMEDGELDRLEGDRDSVEGDLGRR